MYDTDAHHQAGQSVQDSDFAKNHYSAIMISYTCVSSFKILRLREYCKCMREHLENKATNLA